MNISDDISIDNVQTNIFNGELKNDGSISDLNHSKAIVCYRDYDNGGYGTAYVLDINDSITTPGSKTVFNSGDSSYISVSRLTDTKAVVCYRDNSNNSYGTACILNIENNTITPGSEAVFNSGDSGYISVSRLTDDKAVVCCEYNDYDNDNRHGTACILDINNDTITSGNKVVFNNEHSGNISVSRLTDTKAIVCYRSFNNDWYGAYSILNINNNTITPVDSSIINNNYINEISINRLNDNRTIIFFRDIDSGYKIMCLLDAENNNILKKYKISNEIIKNIFIRKIDNNHIIICYDLNDNIICEIIKIENDDIILNKYGIIIDYDIEYINYISEVYDNKLNIIYNKNKKLYNQTIELTHEHI